MRILTNILIFLAAYAMLTFSAMAEPQLDAAKQAGQIGERFDGYVGLVNAGGASDEIKRYVDDVNARRREVYTRLSQDTGQSMASIARKTAEKQFQSAQSGEFIMSDAGKWQSKP